MVSSSIAGEGPNIPTPTELERMSPEGRLAVGTLIARLATERLDPDLRRAADDILRKVSAPGLVNAATEVRCILHALAHDADALAEVIGTDAPSDLARMAFQAAYQGHWGSLKRRARRPREALQQMLQRALELRIPGAELAIAHRAEPELVRQYLRSTVGKVALRDETLEGIVQQDPPLEGNELAQVAKEVAYARCSLRRSLEQIAMGSEPPSPRTTLAAVERASELVFSAMSDAPDAHWKIWLFEAFANDLANPYVLPALRAQLPEACHELEARLHSSWITQMGLFPSIHFNPLSRYDSGGPPTEEEIEHLRLAAVGAASFANDALPGLATVASDLAARYATFTGSAEAGSLMEHCAQLEAIAEVSGWAKDIPTARMERSARELKRRIKDRTIDAQTALEHLASIERDAIQSLRRNDPQPLLALASAATEISWATNEDGASGNEIVDELAPLARELCTRLMVEVDETTAQEELLLAALDPDPLLDIERSAGAMADNASAPSWVYLHRKAASRRVPVEARLRIDHLRDALNPPSSDEDPGGTPHESGVMAYLDAVDEEATQLQPIDRVAAFGVLADIGPGVTRQVRDDEGARSKYLELLLRSIDVATEEWQAVTNEQRALATAWMLRPVDTHIREVASLGTPEQREAALEGLHALDAHVAKWGGLLDEVGVRLDIDRDTFSPRPTTSPSTDAAPADVEEVARAYREGLATHAVPIFRSVVERYAAHGTTEAHQADLQRCVRTLSRRLLQVEELSDPVDHAEPDGLAEATATDGAPRVLEQLDWALPLITSARSLDDPKAASLLAEVESVQGVCEHLLGNAPAADRAMRAAVRYGAVATGTEPSIGAMTPIDPVELWTAMLRARGSLAAEVPPPSRMDPRSGRRLVSRRPVDGATALPTNPSHDASPNNEGTAPLQPGPNDIGGGIRPSKHKDQRKPPHPDTPSW